MTASAAVAAGYTLAAGPVRADVIKTDTEGLDAGDTKIKVADGEMPGYFARPKGKSNPPVVLVAMEIFGLHEYIKDVTRRLAKLGAFAVAPDYYFRKGGDLTKITDMKELLPIVNAKPDAELLSDLDSTVAWAKSQGGDTSRLGIIGFCRGGRTVWEYAAHNAGLKAGVALRAAGRSAEPALAQEPNPARGRDEGACARPLWRGRYRHSRRERRSLEGGAGGKQEDRGVQDLSGRPAWLPRRLSRELPPGGRRGRLESDAGLAQEIQRSGLTATTAVRPLVDRAAAQCCVVYWQTWTVRKRQPWRVCTRRRTR